MTDKIFRRGDMATLTTTGELVKIGGVTYGVYGRTYYEHGGSREWPAILLAPPRAAASGAQAGRIAKLEGGE